MTNSAFVSRTGDTSTVGELDLNSPSTDSGDQISNSQREHNSIASFVGKAVNAVKDLLPTWSSDSIGSANQPVKERVDSVQSQVEANIANITANELAIAAKIDKVTSTDNAVTRFDGITGSVQDSGVTIDDSDNVIIPGDLTVSGTTTTINTSDLDVTDVNITINNAGNQATADDAAGLTVEMSDATDVALIYEDALSSKFKIGEVGSEVEIATVSGAQIITAKDIDGGTASNTNRIALPKDTTTNLDALTDKEALIAYDTTLGTPVFNDGTKWTAVGTGSGSGAGSKNYITNPNFENDTDTATTAEGVTTSVAGVSVLVDSLNPLAGLQSLILKKDAADRSGEYFNFASDTIDLIDRGKTLTCSIAWSPGASYADGNFQLEARQGGSKIQVISDFVDNGFPDAAGEILFRVQSVSSESEIELRLVYTDTNTTAQDIGTVDELKVGPDSAVPGFIGSDWEDFTPTGSWVTNTTYSGKRRRVGDTLEMAVKVATSGAPTATTLTVDLPSGLTIDTAKLNDSTADRTLLDSKVTLFESGVKQYTQSQVEYSDTNTVKPSFSDGSGGRTFISNSAPFTWGASDIAWMYVKVPISGWSSGALISTTENLFGTAEIQTSGNGGEVITANTEDIVFTEVVDSQSLWDGAVFTAPKKGLYLVSGGLHLTSATTFDLIAYINGSADKTLVRVASSTLTTWSSLIELDADDTLAVRTTTGFTLVNSVHSNLSIKEQPDLSVFSVFGETDLVESQSGTVVDYPYSPNVHNDLTTIELIAGEWDIVASVFIHNNGATTYTRALIGVNTVAGDNSTDMIWCQNYSRISGNGTSGRGQDIHIPRYTVNPTTTTTYYLKCNVESSVTNVQYSYRISARRIK